MRLESPRLKADGIAHGFFSREGGVSTGIYQSLNCGPGSKDAPEAIAENRRRIAAALVPGGQPPQLVSLNQVHSNIVHILPAWESRPEGDAMVTAAPGLALGILTADCAPVLFTDPKARVIGAAHAGWKGALGGVLEATLDAMEKLGAMRMRIQAVIGPSISQDAYEVGWDFRDRFLELGLKQRRFFVPSDKEGHYRFDLPGFVAHRLTTAGAGSVESLVETMGVCTYPPENGYFSFRRTTHAGEPDYGRQISAIVLTG
ncbi:MAG: peptidoglycan editing factor PgeF [Alphaproteobacteria bacterium]|nr:peptidoglycan editing factor PgeF [Alphaproteobacteria bacterium]